MELQNHNMGVKNQISGGDIPHITKGYSVWRTKPGRKKKQMEMGRKQQLPSRTQSSVRETS